MIHLTLDKATGLNNDAPESATIIIEGQPESFTGPGWEDRAQLYYETQAIQLAEVLYDTLPGGTLDELIVVMLMRKASLLKVSYGPQEVKP